MKFTKDEILRELDEKHYTAEIGLQTWRGVELSLANYFGISEEKLLEYMREVANRYRLKPYEKRCSSCGMPMIWRGGKPYDREGLIHFISCPNRAAHRK